jgi:hypothetical protein
MHKSPRKFRSVVVFFILALGTGWAGCKKTGSSLTVNPVSYLSLINEATYSGAANVYLNDTLITVQQGIPAGTFSSQYGNVRPATYSVKFVSVSGDSTLATIPGSAFDTLNFYTLILYNPVSGGSSAQAIKIWDDFSTLSTTSANYRFFNLCPDYSSVDLYLNTNLVQPGRTTADNAGNLSLNSFQTIAPANYSVTAKKAGTDSVIAMVTTQMLQGSAYTIFLGGNLKSPSTPVQINVLQASY